ncbi:MAG: histidinol dehydrogenase [Thermodesulfobacteriota bacterium]|nr:histidinol dehydrogenase [Thermodesulfobacteriota bacterium]
MNVMFIKTKNKDFNKFFRKVVQRGSDIDPKIEKSVLEIIKKVKKEGDKALLFYTNKFDRVNLSPDEIKVSPDEFVTALDEIPPENFALIKRVAKRIYDYHHLQIEDSFLKKKDGEGLGMLIRPIEKVGIYVPGGSAPYPSTVLMNAIPAQIAGVQKIIMVTPYGKDGVNPYLLAAAKIAGIEDVFKVGGAQAIAAMAYGTETIPKVDKIVGPGNIYVATAKKLVYGNVAIDIFAGPSEIVIISDGKASSEIVAADILSQAEHDKEATCILITPDEKFAGEVKKSIDNQFISLQRKEIVKASIEKNGIIIISRDIKEAIELANEIAPEHLELALMKPNRWLKDIKNAGAIFLGNNSPATLGDYIAGPNHVLPTGSAARFSSPLGVYDFIKRTNTVSFSPRALRKWGEDVIRFALIEGLDAHANTVSIRLKDR